jgi:hypothetical protein
MPRADARTKSSWLKTRFVQSIRERARGGHPYDFGFLAPNLIRDRNRLEIPRRRTFHREIVEPRPIVHGEAWFRAAGGNLIRQPHNDEMGQDRVCLV